MVSEEIIMLGDEGVDRDVDEGVGCG